MPFLHCNHSNNFESIIHEDGEIEEGVTNMIKTGWLKWRSDS